MTTPVLVAIAVVVLAVVAIAAMKMGGAKPAAPIAGSAPPPAPVAVKVGGKVDLPAEMISRVLELERSAPGTSAGDVARARQLYEEGMAMAETSGGSRERLEQALAKMAASRDAKHGSGLAEAGFAEVLRQAALADEGNPHQAALEKSLELAQKATAQNSMEGEAWAAYAMALIASGAVDDGLAVLHDHAAYQGYRMARARAEAAIRKGDWTGAASSLELAAGGAGPDARKTLDARLAWVRART